jgi:hypothetical protein
MSRVYLRELVCRLHGGNAAVTELGHRYRELARLNCLIVEMMERVMVQRSRVAELARDGNRATTATALLRQLELSLHSMIKDRAAILRELRRYDAAPAPGEASHTLPRPLPGQG